LGRSSVADCFSVHLSVIDSQSRAITLDIDYHAALLQHPLSFRNRIHGFVRNGIYTMISAEQLEQYRADGYFILKDAIPAEHLDLLRTVCADGVAAMDARMEAEGTEVLGINHKGKRYFIGQSYRDHAELAEFLFSALMKEICRATIGETAYLHNDQFVVKMEKAGMKFSWHQDGAYVHARVGDHPEHITCWCALDDVDESNGTVYLLPFSRLGRRELVEHIKDPETNDRVGYGGKDQGDPVVVTAGSVAVFSSLLLHRSGANPTGTVRRAYLAQYAPAPIRNAPGEFPQYFAEPFLQEGGVVSNAGG
jgi:ectoine hydroxylase-related dioxygenase (phytanoyl-CoA dioxygenase family)